MPKLIFTQDEIDNFVKDRSTHVFYKQAVELSEMIYVHADGGKNPDGTVSDRVTKLLYERRPNEPLEVQEYRKKRYIPKTKPVFSKIFSSLQKIRRSSDWSIRYGNEMFPRIAEGETLQEYADENYPGFTSLTNWVFTLMLRKYLIDPNAVVYVAPIASDVEQNEYLKPIAQIFDSKYVVDFVENDYAVLLNPVGAIYYSGGKPVKGKRFLICTTQQILVYDQINGNGKFALADTYNHGLGVLPAFKLKGVIIDQNTGSYLYESRISGIVPELDEALTEYSDLQAAKVLHIYPERWEYTQFECTSCKGTGRRKNPAWFDGCASTVLAHIDCDAPGCRQGYVVSGPYSKIMVKPPGMGEQSIPTPPAGYVEKDVDIVKVMEESVQNHIYNALASINFEFLEKSPLAQSGIAKAYDGDEMNNTAHSIAEDIVAAQDNIYWLIALWRYRGLYSYDDIYNMLPTVAVPEKFDILSASHMQEEIKIAKESKTNPVITSALEIDYATRRFNAEPEVRDRVQLILKLDPMPNISEDDKMSRLSNNGITQESYVISSNIQAFVQRAIDQEKGFVDMELEKQQEVMVKYAEEITQAEENAATPTDTGLDSRGNPIPPNNNGQTNGNGIPAGQQNLPVAV